MLVLPLLRTYFRRLLAPGLVLALALLLPLLAPAQTTPPGNALAFDGQDDYVHVPQTLPATGEFTLLAWVNPAALTNQYSALLLADDFSAGALHCQFYGDRLGFTINGNSPVDVVSSVGLPLGRWAHVAVVYSASARTVSFYHNGTLTTTTTYATARAVGAQPYSLGGWRSGSSGSRFFQGRLDEVRLYTAALSQAQVQAEMTSSGATGPGLAVAYNFNQGTAGGANTSQTTLPAQTGGHAGTLLGFALTSGTTTSNWVESYAQVRPTATAATGVTTTSFTATWTAPAVGVVDNGYRVAVSPNATFTTGIAGSPFTVSTGTTLLVSGLTPGTTYHYRVRADKTSVTGQGAWSDAVAVTVPVSTPTRLYVNEAVATPGLGGSWATAQRSLGEALEQARANAAITEVWVAKGTYLPTHDPFGSASPADPRDKTFYLRNGLKVYGGFAGTETALTQRVSGNATVLSGDFLGDDVVSGSGSTLSFTGNTENAYHVLLSVHATAGDGTLLDGLTVTGGHASGGGHLTVAGQDAFRNWAGGMFNLYSSPQLINCLFTHNATSGIYTHGGGMANTNSSPTLTNCTFTANAASGSRTSYGGGIYNVSSSPQLTNCTFTANAARGFENYGAGMANTNSSPTLTNCTFTANTVNATNSNGVSYGGGISNFSSSPQLTNCSFTANAVSGGANFGGGIDNDSSSPRLTNCTFTANTASGQYVNCGGGMANTNSSPTLTNCTFTANNVSGGNSRYGGGLYYNANSGGILQNCILWNNAGGPANRQNILKSNDPAYNMPLMVGYSLLGDYNAANPGATANVTFNGPIGTADPLFVDAANPAGPDGLFGTADDGLRLQAASPAIDAGDPALTTPATDLLGYPRSGPFDQGAYEYEDPATFTRLYVRAGITTAGLGGSWATAQRSLGEALEQARANAAITEVWVAKGTYLPTHDPFGNAAPGDPRNKTFYLRNGLKVYGGFGGTETALTQRVSGNATVLSGDFLGNDQVSGSGSTLTFTNNGENAYHVLLSIGTASGTLLDRLTIKGGNANGGYAGTVAGQSLYSQFGGGMYNAAASPVLTNCIFVGNAAASPGGSYGGGMYNDASSPVLTNCIFANNTAGPDNQTQIFVQYGGGGMYNSNSAPVLTNCTFTGNVARGGDYNYGGGLYYDRNPAGTVQNCILWNNVVSTYNQVYSSDINYHASGATQIVRYSLVGSPDPLFVDAANPAGPDGLFGTADDGLRLQAASPAIDAGAPALTTPASDLTGYPRQGIFDLGAYEAPPTITSLSPAAELPGLPVTLTGTGLGSATAVRFGGRAASAVSYDPLTRQLTATVPAALPAGSQPVVAGTGSGTSLSAPAFTALKVYDGGSVETCTTAVPATPTVADGQWHYLLSTSGQVVLAYNYSGSNLGSFGAELLRADPAQPVRRDGGQRAYLDRNWHLTASGGSFTGRTVRLRFFGLTSELARLQAADSRATPAALNASQYQGANEDCDLRNNLPGALRLLPAPATVADGAGWFSAEASVADHFSEFYLTAASQPLPVELVSFTAVAQSRAIALAWRTASEQNADRFEVERSPDGQQFTPIGRVAAQGSSSTATAYGYRDAQPLAGTSYYRLRQVDVDGTAAYSPVRAVTLGGTAGLTLFPNPARTAVTAQGLTAGATVQVCDALGRTVAVAMADAGGTARLALPLGLPAGVYTMRSGAQASRLIVE